ncbi:antitoxin [Streptomyces sp. NPDC001700]
MGIMDKLKDAIAKNPDKSRQAARKGADAADKKTGGKHSDQIKRGSDKVDDELRRRGEGPRGGER